MSTLTPYLSVSNAVRAIEFYKQAFGAEETMRLAEPSGKIGHAEITVNGALVMLADEYPDYGCVSPETLKGTPVSLHLMVPNVDEFVDRAVQAGARLERPVADQFYGLRSGTIQDPFGHRWQVSTVIENLTNEELQRRAAKAMGGDR